MQRVVSTYVDERNVALSVLQNWQTVPMNCVVRLTMMLDGNRRSLSMVTNGCFTLCVAA